MNKGWSRLLIILSSLWLLISASFVLYERETINPFDQFDNPPGTYTFFAWQRQVLENEKLVEIQLIANKRKIMAFTFGPIIILWSLALSFVWVSNGFQQSKI
ncbi:hypothetical protein HG547_19765 [Shewanella sp. DNRA4]|uniref:hypothetical protein n=1 Tax=Shewanella TaxID=22 RepID=UPI00146DB1E3|nr:MULTISPECIES: hypothetical protein [Shewanella]NMD53842.1 hypothetical protein [Shewanella sp. DNRA4]WVI92871.1 hypothetical protein VR487_18915 [Shewanella oncorhynchi]